MVHINSATKIISCFWGTNNIFVDCISTDAYIKYLPSRTISYQFFARIENSKYKRDSTEEEH